MASPENPEQLIIALEPEAASIYCRKLRLHQMIDLSSRAPVNGYSPSDTIGTGFTQGTSSINSLLQILMPEFALSMRAAFLPFLVFTLEMFQASINLLL